MLPEFDQEFATVRKFLEAVPEDKLDYKPHAKSMEMGRLAGHLAEIVNWIDTTVNTDVLDFATFDYQPCVMTDRAETLKQFDEWVAEGRKILAGASDAKLMEPWTMRTGEEVYFTLPKVAVIRSFVMNHMIHHRAQLGMYLRIVDVAPPSAYGPTAEEMPS